MMILGQNISCNGRLSLYELLEKYHFHIFHTIKVYVIFGAFINDLL